MTKHQIQVITSVEPAALVSGGERAAGRGDASARRKYFGDRALGRHPCEPALPLAQGALPNLRAVRPATRSGGGRRSAASASGPGRAAAGLPAAQEGKHGDDRAWRWPPPAGRADAGEDQLAAEMAAVRWAIAAGGALLCLARPAAGASRAPFEELHRHSAGGRLWRLQSAVQGGSRSRSADAGAVLGPCGSQVVPAR